MVQKGEQGGVDGTGGTNEEVNRKKQEQWLTDIDLLYKSLAVNECQYSIFSNVSFGIDFSAEN